MSGDRTRQKNQVLCYMRMNGAIDPWMCAKTFGHWKLATVISELRRDHSIEDEWLKTRTGKRYKRYWLPRVSMRKAA